MILFADECIPPLHFRALGEALKVADPPVECIHLLDKLRSGIDDEAVADYLATLDRPVCLSADNGRTTRGDDPRLPLILPERGITGVWFAPALAPRPGFVKMQALMSQFDRVRAAHDGPPGARYRIYVKGDDTNPVFRFESWPVPESKG